MEEEAEVGSTGNGVDDFRPLSFQQLSDLGHREVTLAAEQVCDPTGDRSALPRPESGVCHKAAPTRVGKTDRLHRPVRHQLAGRAIGKAKVRGLVDDHRRQNCDVERHGGILESITTPQTTPVPS